MEHSIDYLCSMYNFSLNDLADYLGVGSSQIGQWKKGTRPIPKKHLKKMCYIFNIPYASADVLKNNHLNDIDKEKIKLIRAKNTLLDTNRSSPLLSTKVISSIESHLYILKTVQELTDSLMSVQDAEECRYYLEKVKNISNEINHN